MANLGPASVITINTQPPRATLQFVQTIGVTLTPVAVVTISASEQSYGSAGVSFVSAVTGILPGDVILAVSPPSATAGVTLASFRVDAAVADKFYITFVNPTAGSVTPVAGVYLITVARFISSVSTTPATLSTLPSAITLN